MEDRVCVLHDDIEGPAMDLTADYPNNFATPRLRVSASFYHYEKLGVGNSTDHVFTNLSLVSGNTYYINLRLQNGLGYSSIVTSPGIVVDFTPPDPGPIANADSNYIIANGCAASIVQQCIEPITDQPNHRYEYRFIKCNAYSPCTGLLLMVLDQLQYLMGPLLCWMHCTQELTTSLLVNMLYS